MCSISKADRAEVDFDLRLSIDVLERTPATLRALLQDVDAKLARGTEGPDTFSPFDNIGHLIDGEETDWMARARIILAQGANRRFDRTIGSATALGMPNARSTRYSTSSPGCGSRTFGRSSPGS